MCARREAKKMIESTTTHMLLTLRSEIAWFSYQALLRPRENHHLSGRVINSPGATEMIRESQEQTPKGLPELAQRLLDAPNIGHLATLMPDGSPHCTSVWVGRDGHVVLVNSVEGRVKVANVRRDPRVALSLVSAADPDVGVSIRGLVREVTFEGAEELIDDLSEKYYGVRPYPLRTPGMRRVTLVIKPTKVI
jgi:PPOX class probable F420-dependent enzyme